MPPRSCSAISQAEAGAIGDGAAARLVTEQIGYGVVAGVVAGVLAAAVLVTASRRHALDPLWAHTVPVTAALLAYTWIQCMCFGGGGTPSRGLRAHQLATCAKESIIGNADATKGGPYFHFSSKCASLAASSTRDLCGVERARFFMPLNRDR